LGNLAARSRRLRGRARQPGRISGWKLETVASRSQDGSVTWEDEEGWLR